MKPTPHRLLTGLLLGALPLLAACRATHADNGPGQSPLPSASAWTHPTTAEIDQLSATLIQPGLSEGDRVLGYSGRWPVVTRAVDHAGVMHDDAFYASRSYWHTGFVRGRRFAFEHDGDLIEKTYVDGKGGIRISGNCNADLEITGEAIVFIYGDLNATLTLHGNCEVVIAGHIGDNAAIACDGLLHLFAGGEMRGRIGCTNGSVIVVDDAFTGVIQCGQPASRITVTGDLTGRITPPHEAEALLNLRVDGYMPSQAVLDVMSAGFTRVNATIGISDTQPGLYPVSLDSDRPVASRWVVLRQRVTTAR